VCVGVRVRVCTSVYDLSVCWTPSRETRNGDSPETRCTLATCMHVYIEVCVCLSVCLPVSLCIICMHVHMHMHVCVHACMIYM